MSSTIIETAVTGQIKNAQEKVGTPNRKLQTYLNTAPSVNITPASLPPVVLFAGDKPPHPSCYSNPLPWRSPSISSPWPSLFPKQVLCFPHPSLSPFPAPAHPNPAQLHCSSCSICTPLFKDSPPPPIRAHPDPSHLFKLCPSPMPHLLLIQLRTPCAATLGHV